MARLRPLSVSHNCLSGNRPWPDVGLRACVGLTLFLPVSSTGHNCLPSSCLHHFATGTFLHAPCVDTLHKTPHCLLFMQIAQSNHNHNTTKQPTLLVAGFSWYTPVSCIVEYLDSVNYSQWPLWQVLNQGRSVLVHTPICVASHWFRLFFAPVNFCFAFGCCINSPCFTITTRQTTYSSCRWVLSVHAC